MLSSDQWFYRGNFKNWRNIAQSYSNHNPIQIKGSIDLQFNNTCTFLLHVDLGRPHTTRFLACDALPMPCRNDIM